MARFCHRRRIIDVQGSMMLVVVMGVAGSGKTTVGQRLAAAITCAFLEGDSLHSRSSVQKMSRGIPLTDADRAGWLDAIHARMADAFRQEQSLVVACSALKQSYRDVLAEDLPVQWVYLKASEELLRSRLTNRAGHFMKAGMLSSQLATLEEPSDAIVVDAAQPADEIVEQLCRTIFYPNAN
jgi:gluconokinase